MALRWVDPETAHRLTIRMLQALPRAAGLPPDPPILAIRLWGLPFANPVGLAAGFDKNAEVADRFARLGFGFVEVGGVTPRPQPGNPKPRVFRLPQDRAVINRLGFNNDGLEVVRRRLQAMRPSLVPLGVNLGVNKDSADRLADFVRGVEALHGLVDYYTINVSSPNTPGLRQLQEKAQLATLLQTVVQARDGLDAGAARRTPVLVKLAPDLSEAELADVAEVTLATGVDGAIVGNTSTGLRDGLRSARGREPGGLSGAPLFALSTEVLRRFRRHTQGRLPLIGAGGVDSGRAAYAKIRAGASLVQLYTALVYEGPGLVSRIKRELAGLLQADGFANVADAVGVDAD